MNPQPTETGRPAMKPLFDPSSACLPLAFTLAVITATAPVTAHADDWEKITDDSGHSVEINKSTIFNADHGTKVSWGRIVLNDSEAKQTGYRMIKALNHYDCLGRSFTTIKRVYLDDQGNILREEVVPEQRPVMVRSNSVDEQIWRRVCVAPPTASGQSSRSKATPKSDIILISKLADTAHLAALNALQPTDPARTIRNAPATAPEKSPVSRQGNPAGSVKMEIAPAPPKAALLPTAAAVVAAELQKTSDTPAATDSPQSAPVLPLPIQVKPVPTPSVPRNPATPVAPKRLEYPTAPRSQKRPLDAVPSSRRESATQPLVLPAPGAPAQNAKNRQVAVQRPQESGEDWGYSGAVGPEFWGKLRPEWKSCAEGKRQSPVDFSEGKPIAVNLDPVKFDYRPSSFTITNTRHQLRVKITEAMGMEVRAQRYILEGFTLRRPGEIRFDNKIADMEAHFFHRDDKGRIAVLAVQFKRGSESSAALQTLLNNLPLERGDSHRPQATLDMAGFLPTSPAHYLHMGSLTTPPCTEGVLWVVMKEPMALSDEQFDIFFRLQEENARPPQPVFDRLILESR